VVESRGLLDYQMLTLNCVRWTRENSPGFGPEGRFTLSEEARNGILDFLAHGRGLLALHCATICFDDWPEYRRILGAYWEWGVSGHAPTGMRASAITRWGMVSRRSNMRSIAGSSSGARSG